MFFSHLCDRCSFSKGWREAHLIDDTVSDTIALCLSHKYKIKLYKILHNYSFMTVHEFNTLKDNTFMQNLLNFFFFYSHITQYSVSVRHSILAKCYFLTNFWPDFGIEVIG